jgi:hypothetical protein
VLEEEEGMRGDIYIYIYIYREREREREREMTSIKIIHGSKFEKSEVTK